LWPVGETLQFIRATEEKAVIGFSVARVVGTPMAGWANRYHPGGMIRSAVRKPAGVVRLQVRSSLGRQKWSRQTTALTFPLGSPLYVDLHRFATVMDFAAGFPTIARRLGSSAGYVTERVEIDRPVPAGRLALIRRRWGGRTLVCEGNEPEDDGRARLALAIRDPRNHLKAGTGHVTHIPGVPPPVSLKEVQLLPLWA
jgi:hypothetical protein